MMATGDSSLASVDLDDLLECPVCLERLDVSSKVLPCQHVFCRRCLEKWSNTHKELTCPECRVRVYLSIDELPSNILLNRILERVCQISQTFSKEGNDRKATNRRRHQHKHGSVPLDPNFYPGVHARALYCYQPEKRRQELSLAAGDVIVLLRRIHRSWYQAESRGLRGLVPINYVQVLSEEEEKNLPSTLPPRRFVARFEFKRDSDTFGSYLNFAPGDTLELIRQVDDNWALGQIGSRQALFPISFVEEVGESSISPVYCAENGNLMPNDCFPSNGHMMPLVKMHSSLPLVAQVPVLPCDRRSVDMLTGELNAPVSHMHEQITPLKAVIAGQKPIRSPPPILSKQHAPLRRHHQHIVLMSRGRVLSSENGDTADGITFSSCSRAHRGRSDESVTGIPSISSVNRSGSVRPLPASLPFNNFSNSFAEVTLEQQSDSILTAAVMPQSSSTESSHKKKRSVEHWVDQSAVPADPTSATASLIHSGAAGRQRMSFLSRLQSVFSSASCTRGGSNHPSSNNSSVNANADQHHSTTTESSPHTAIMKAATPAAEEVPLVHTRSSRRGAVERPHSMFALNSLLPSYRCVVPYPAASESELTLHYGDIIFVSETRQDGWCRGRLQRSGRDGLFPATFVQPLQKK